MAEGRIADSKWAEAVGGRRAFHQTASARFSQRLPHRPIGVSRTRLFTAFRPRLRPRRNSVQNDGGGVSN